MNYFLQTLAIFIFSTQIAFAGSLNISNKNSSEEIKVGDEVLVEVEIKTGEEIYNAVGGELLVDPGFEVRQIVTGNSIVSAWIENPIKSKTNDLKFSGIIAGGLKGNGSIFQIILVPKKQGNLIIQMKDPSIFLNDGLGTEEKLNSQSITLNIRNIQPGESNSKISLIDKTPPEYFEVTLVKDKNIADNKYVVVFEASDKGSGIKTYEVLEGKKLFKQAESPYVLVNQRINERIYIKAIDGSGNERIVKLDLPNKICLSVKCFDQTTTIIILVLISLVSFILWRRQSRELKKISPNF